MQWEKYNITESGKCKVNSVETVKIGKFESGNITTGKSQIFKGYFVKVYIDNEQFVGEDNYNLIDALKKCAEILAERNYVVDFPGLSEDFYETGLSNNTGWGYSKKFSDKRISAFYPEV